MQITRDITLQIATDSTATTLLFDNTQAGDPPAISRMTTCSSGLIEMPAAGATVRLSFGNVQAAYGCYVALNQDAILTVDGHDFQMRVGQQSTGFWEYTCDAQLSSLIVSTPVGPPAQGTFTVWGDPPIAAATPSTP